MEEAEPDTCMILAAAQIDIEQQAHMHAQAPICAHMQRSAVQCLHSTTPPAHRTALQSLAHCS